MSPRSFLVEDLTDSGEQRPRRERRKPRGKGRAAEFLTTEQAAGDVEAQYTDPLLAQLQARGHVTEIIGELKSGKEATVYAARGLRGPVAVKLYRDLGARSFRNDALYTEGRFIADARTRRAVENRSQKGLEAAQNLWVAHEWRELWTLFLAGLPVPEPLIGPDPHTIAEAGRAVLMRFVGEIGEEGAVAAPRLSDLRLSLAEARATWDQALDIMARLLALGRVHGDYSTYNLLFWEGTVTVIDFPQLTTRENPHFERLLQRDAESLARSFARHGLFEDPVAALREVRARARRLSAQAPRVTLP